MPHIHSEPGQHDVVVCAYIVRVEKNQPPRALLHRHKRLNKLLQPGSHVEVTENPWQAIIHEIREETGYDIHQLKILQSVPGIEPAPDSDAIYLPVPVAMDEHRYGDKDHFHDALAYAFMTTELPNGEPDEDESQEFYWVDLEKLNTLTDNEIMRSSKEIYKYVLENFENWRAEDVDKFGGGEWRS
jgi:8-oxo-dGTP pyrophosphatase MutT (NUDIX family)